MSPHFTVRYRRIYHPTSTVLIVEDAHHRLYLFSGGRLRSRLSQRLAGQIAASDRWIPVPAVPPYTLAGLRHLLPQGHEETADATG